MPGVFVQYSKSTSSSWRLRKINVLFAGADRSWTWRCWGDCSIQLHPTCICYENDQDLVDRYNRNHLEGLLLLEALLMNVNKDESEARSTTRTVLGFAEHECGKASNCLAIASLLANARIFHACARKTLMWRQDHLIWCFRTCAFIKVQAMGH